MYDRWFTIALLALEFGQVWAKLGLQKSRMTLGEIARLHNCAVTVCSKLTDMRPLDDIASTKMYTTGIHFHVKLKA